MSRTIDLWEPVARPEGPADWFAEAGNMPAFDPADPKFSLANAWWLASLCRIAYTPDRKESARRWHRDKPARRDFLENRTPFREVLNVHKTASHAALYRLDGIDGAVLCFRGTNKLRQWILNLTALPAPWSRCGGQAPAIFVHHGFQLLFNRLWPMIEPSLAEIEGPLVLTGHSLGAVFATLAVAALPEKSAASLVTFGSPRVGNAAFADRLNACGTPHHRVVNCHDVVTRLPLQEPFLKERDYRHTARPIILGSEGGSVYFGALPGTECDPGWMPDRPLTSLARGFKAPEPPEGILAHLPIAYEKKLAAALSAGAHIPAGSA